MKLRRVPLINVSSRQIREEAAVYRDPIMRMIDIPEAVNRYLTKTQKSYIMLYYTENKSVPEIARLYGVNKSTVSRTIRRGTANLCKIFGDKAC